MFGQQLERKRISGKISVPHTRKKLNLQSGYSLAVFLVVFLQEERVESERRRPQRCWLTANRWVLSAANNTAAPSGTFLREPVQLPFQRQPEAGNVSLFR